ncbi:DUF5723 family protein [Alistipes shahii]|uniref:DUF5723 family protein n=1 Tax=Alistipes shahii TaxID=328814 RepID=UPI00293D9A1C|nr:DUF5723 family protein [Alistipes shahii]
MKKIYTLIAAALLATGAAAQNPTAYFMEGSTFRSQFNPAFAPLRGYVNIPAIGGVNINVGGNIAVDNILFSRDGKLVTLLDSSVSAADALSGLKQNNLLGMDFRMNVIGFGAFTKNHKNFWSFDLNVRVNEDANLPYSLFEFIKLGKEGQIRNFGTSTDSYLEAAFSYSFPLMDDRLYIGIRGKFLAGLARAQVTYDRFDISLREDRWAVLTQGTLDLTAAGAKVETDPDSETFEIGDLDFKPTKPAGYGFALDLGATYDILPNLQASLAVTDLGFISWSKKNSVMGVSTQETEFTGATVPENASEPVPDFDLEMLKFNQVDGRSTTKMLRASVNAGLEYEVWRHKIGIGLLYTARVWEYKTHAQHHRIGQFPPRALVHGVGKLFGDRQPRRSRRPGAEPLPQLDQFLSGNRRADFEAHTAVGPHQAEFDERNARPGHPHRQAEPPHRGLRPRRRQTLTPPRKQANSRLDEPGICFANASRRPDRAPGQAAAARKKTDLPREKGPPLRNFGRTHITFGQSDCKSGNFLYLCPVRNPEMFSAISFIPEYIAMALKSV